MKKIVPSVLRGLCALALVSTLVSCATSGDIKAPVWSPLDGRADFMSAVVRFANYDPAADILGFPDAEVRMNKAYSEYLKTISNKAEYADSRNYFCGTLDGDRSEEKTKSHPVRESKVFWGNGNFFINHFKEKMLDWAIAKQMNSFLAAAGTTVSLEQMTQYMRYGWLVLRTGPAESRDGATVLPLHAFIFVTTVYASDETLVQFPFLLRIDAKGEKSWEPVEVKAVQPSPDPSADAAASPAPGQDLKARLKTLKDLLDQSLITEEEYKAKREELLKSL